MINYITKSPPDPRRQKAKVTKLTTNRDRVIDKQIELIFDVLVDHNGADSHAEIAEWTGLSVSTVSTCLTHLRNQSIANPRHYGWTVPLAEIGTGDKKFFVVTLDENGKVNPADIVNLEHRVALTRGMADNFKHIASRSAHEKVAVNAFADVLRREDPNDPMYGQLAMFIVQSEHLARMAATLGELAAERAEM